MATLTEALNAKAFSRDMKIGLFIPCYIDMVYPEVGIATLELLERFGLTSGSRSTRRAAVSRCPTAATKRTPPPRNDSS
jgi:hypothetical protein